VAARLPRLRRRSLSVADHTGPITLSQSRIFILPTRSGLLFGVTALVMLFGCVNYNLGLGYLLTFLMGGLALVSMLHTFRNLVGLQLTAARPQPVFVGEVALFPFLLGSAGLTVRRSIGLASAEQRPNFVDIANAQATVVVGTPALHRGWLRLGDVRVFTTFPLGLFRAWSNLESDVQCLIYPRPEREFSPLPAPRAGDSKGIQNERGQDDFAGLRQYQYGDSLRHVAWKTAARTDTMMTKQFCGLAGGELWLDWDALPAGLHQEARLSRLTRWVLEAASAGHAYGLQLPSVVIPIGSGAAHRLRCLAALALFGE